MPYPWQEPVWRILQQSRARGTLPHAFLFSGVAGVGKHRFSDAFAAWLLCRRPTPEGGCGQCKDCQLWQAGSHPDYRLLQAITDDKTGKTSKVIKVDQVRELVGFLTKSAQLGGYRVAVIEPADILNVNAANSLLKTLEEPGAHTAIVLLTDQPLALLPTLRSRCQHFALSAPGREQARAWLAPQLKNPEQADLLLNLSENAPLAALALQDKPWFGQRQALAQALVAVAERRQPATQAAQQWQKALPPEELLPALQLVLADALFTALGQQDAIKNTDLLPIIAPLATRLGPARLTALHDDCLESRRLLEGNVQGQLLLDNFWQALR